ncbi:M15 family metallopeptidase [Asanoa sp. WMMD1127]|uniref:M15 family metallopeptidase n=1 Tax=Asanoa sp. WMMD1127 TaxID=3016107 RepID=UPI0024171AAF|nr:M15 family metallopeptidase [Asanoa sp. WMMD1127]MDG4824773.1 M15 family metallopeptidase [Asanoa sp. WMMD1127]
MILISDPRVAAVPVGDNGEPLVDLRAVPGLRVDDRLADPSGAYARLRAGAVDRLLAAQRALPRGLRLLVVEAYRPLRLQRAYFSDYQDQLRARFPDWDEERLHVEASKFVSPPSVAPHSSGGTVDLTLAGPDGRELDMGTAVNDSPVASGNACFTAAVHISPPARRNRYVLGAALRSAGFVNYPTEWWHWSYGDRYWALGTGAAETRYGPVEFG